MCVCVCVCAVAWRHRVSLPQERSKAGLVFYTRVARSRSESTSHFTAFFESTFLLLLLPPPDPPPPPPPTTTTSVGFSLPLSLSPS